MPPKARPLDEARALALRAEGKTWKEVSAVLGVPRTTLSQRLADRDPQAQRIDTPTPAGPTTAPPGTPEVHNSGQEGQMPSSHAGVHDVYNSGLTDILDDLQAMARWWRERQSTLQDTGADDKPERVTYHVQRRWIEAVRREADLERRSITEVVNQIFRAYFTHK